MAETRKIAAIVVADVVGYSRLTGTDEERTLARLRALRSDLIDPAIAVHHGRVVKRTGDGSLIEFRSVVDAVRCAIEVQSGMIERNAGLPPERRIEFRVGIHLGDVVEEQDGDLMGDGVNIAARLESIAKPGAICLSEDAYRQVKARLNLTVIDLGETQLKNITETIRVYSLEVGVDAQDKLAPRGQSGGAEPASAPLALPDKPSIAVLPFQNMSGDPEQDYFVDGIVEDIITGLARIKWVFVIARNSSFVYKGRSVDVRQVGRELGVRYVLEGSVRKSGNRLRITGQLIEAETGTHLWADRYDGTLNEVFDLQDQITASVVGVVEPNLRRAEIERARRKPPDNLGAYDLYLRALPLCASAMPEDAELAIGLLEQALELDANYAAAHAWLAWCLEARFVRGGFVATDRVEGARHARLGLAYGSDDPTSLSHAALVILHLDYDFVTASSAIERALALNNSSATAFYTGSHIHAWSGDPAIAEDYANRAFRLSPFDPQLFHGYESLGCVRLRAKRYEEAASFFAQAVQANPRFSYLYADLAAALALVGRAAESQVAARRALELEPGFRIQPLIAALGGFPRLELTNELIAGWRKAGLPE